MTDWTYDNHIVAKIQRFLMTFWRRSDTYEDITGYEKETGRCVFVGYSYLRKDGEDMCKLIWAHPEVRDEIVEKLAEEE